MSSCQHNTPEVLKFQTFTLGTFAGESGVQKCKTSRIWNTLVPRISNTETLWFQESQIQNMQLAICYQVLGFAGAGWRWLTCWFGSLYYSSSCSKGMQCLWMVGGVCGLKGCVANGSYWQRSVALQFTSTLLGVDFPFLPSSLSMVILCWMLWFRSVLCFGQSIAPDVELLNSVM